RPRAGARARGPDVHPRPEPVRRHRGQPGRQRAQARRAAGDPHRARHGQRSGGQGARPRQRHTARGASARLRPLLQSGSGTRPQSRQRVGPVHRPLQRPAARRHHLGQAAEPGNALHGLDSSAMRRLRPLLLLSLLLTGCGIQPNYATEVGPPPVIDFESKLEVVYLLRDSKLEPRKVSTSSDLIEDILDALFKAGEPPPPGMKSALTGFTLVESSLTVYNPRSRNDPEVPTGLRLHVSVRGE